MVIDFAGESVCDGRVACDDDGADDVGMVRSEPLAI